MSALDDLQFNLPIGIRVSKTVLRETTLRQVSGRIRREMLNAPTEAAKTRAAIEHILERIGPLALAQIPGGVTRLTGADIDYLHLLVSLKENGPRLEWTIQCEGCDAKPKVAVDLTKVALLPGTGEICWNERDEAYQETSFVDPVGGQDIGLKVRCATLMDQLRMTDRALAQRKSKGSSNAPSAGLGDFMFAQLSQLMLEYGGQGRGLTEVELDGLPSRPLDALLDATQKVRPPQVDLEVNFNCPNCRNPHVLELPVDRWCAPFANREP